MRSLIAMPWAGMAFLISCTVGNAVGLVTPGVGDPARDDGCSGEPGGETDIFSFNLRARLLSDMAPPSRSLSIASVSDPALPAARLRIFSAADGSSPCDEPGDIMSGDMGREWPGEG